MHKQQPVSRTPWQTDGRTVGQTNRHFSIFYSRQGKREEEEGEEAEAGTTFATTCRDISLLHSCLYCALFLPLSLLLLLCRTLAIFPALTISNLIRHFVEAANHPSEQIHQTKPSATPLNDPCASLMSPPPPFPTPALTTILWFLLLAFYYICLFLCLCCQRCFLHKNVEIPEDILLCNFLTSR